MGAPDQPNRTAPARPILVYFKLRALDDRIAACMSFRTDRGIELRFGFDDEAPQRVQLVESHTRALELATQWRVAILSGRRFREARWRGDTPGGSAHQTQG